MKPVAQRKILIYILKQHGQKLCTVMLPQNQHAIQFPKVDFRIATNHSGFAQLLISARGGACFQM
jgi:hypothetical protein